MQVRVSELPETLQEALRAVDYHAKDVRVEARESVCVQVFANDGARAICSAVNLETGGRNLQFGSWGGPNPYEQRQLDSDRRDHAIPVNGAVILGETDWRRKTPFVTVYIHPDNFAKLIPEKLEISLKQKFLLTLYRDHNSAGRKCELERLPPSFPVETINQELETLKLIKRNKRGAISLTTEGKNAAGDYWQLSRAIRTSHLKGETDYD